MVGESDVPREHDSQPITAHGHLHALGELLQNRQVIGLELVGQGDVELLLVRFDVDVWTDNIK